MDIAFVFGVHNYVFAGGIGGGGKEIAVGDWDRIEYDGYVMSLKIAERIQLRCTQTQYYFIDIYRW